MTPGISCSCDVEVPAAVHSRSSCFLGHGAVLILWTDLLASLATELAMLFVQYLQAESSQGKIMQTFNL